MHARTPGCDLPDDVAKTLFSEHLKVSSCSPNTLWSLQRVTQNHLSSDWSAMKKAFAELHFCLEKSGGLIPRQLSFSRQLTSWLREGGFDWQPAEIDACTMRFRMMLRPLLDRKRRDQGAPRNFSELAALMNMLQLSSKRMVGDEVGEPPDLDRPASKRIRGKQDVVTEVPIVKKPVDVVQISDSSETDSDFEKLEKKLFKNTTSTSTRAPLTAAQLVELAQGAAAGPSPGDYMAVSREETKKHAESKNKTMVPAPLPDDSKDMATPMETAKQGAKGVASDAVDPIEPYLKMNGKRSVIRKRVHSRAYVLEKGYHLAQGASKEEACKKAQVYACAQAERWSTLWSGRDA
eukprot:3536399-Pyramimonas_sp.AAC.1